MILNIEQFLQKNNISFKSNVSPWFKGFFSTLIDIFGCYLMFFSRKYFNKQRENVTK
ncbi:hypothetical protein P784_2076 [Enterococcus faecalis GAN13]|nr:hypothetical protein P784_2076 [Enterococcus faecalis GAN13]